jgi:hypothetical protein
VVTRLEQSFHVRFPPGLDVRLIGPEMWAAFEAGASDIALTVRGREAAANHLRPNELWFGSTPRAERIGWIDALAAECVEFLTDPSTKLLIARAPSPAPDPRFAWMWPPRDVHDASAWDRYWTEHAVRNFPVTRFFDRISDVDGTAVMLRDNGLRSVLCVGSGVSCEPPALAAAGFEVTVLELSTTAIELARTMFGLVPRLTYLGGSLLDDRLLPGPFDMIIERRTLQLFNDTDRREGLAALARRLGNPGVFLSHCHDSTASPGGRASHATRSWFTEQGWRTVGKGDAIEGRCAWFVTSTG